MISLYKQFLPYSQPNHSISLQKEHHISEIFKATTNEYFSAYQIDYCFEKTNDLTLFYPIESIFIVISVSVSSRARIDAR